MIKNIFINKFEEGSSENANLGMGNMVGIDTYSKKRVAVLAKKSNLGDNFNVIPHFLELSDSSSKLWAQFSDGAIYTSVSPFTSWTNTSFPDPGGGNGMIYFQNYMIAFTNTAIYYYSIAGGGPWTSWKTGLKNLGTSPIAGCHFPYLFPSNKGVYFANGGQVGFFGQVGTTIFDPTGAAGVNYLYNDSILVLPSLTYAINTLDFLPPSNLAISALAFQNPEGADLITWDTQTINKFNPPLRLYSNSQINQGGIKQLFNRNQVLYAVAGGNHTVYETNASSFNLVEDIALYSNVRTTSGTQDSYPVFFNSYPQAITVLGNKLLTGIATPDNSSTYPSTGNGLFPIGVWSIAFNQDGTKSTQCEFTLPVGNVVSPSGTGNYAKVTCLKSLGNGQIAVGFGVKNTALSAGIAIVDSYNFIDDISKTAIESPMYEIGTPLNPTTVNNIETNLVKKLLPGQVVDISYRTGFDQDWTIIDTYTGDGTTNQYKLTKNPIGATQYIQLRVRMKTGSPNATKSPELRTVILS